MEPKRLLSALIALLLLFCLMPASAQADGVGTIVVHEGNYLEEVPAGHYAENYGTIGTNNGTVTINNGTITTNNGAVTTNKGMIDTNNGDVSTNGQIIGGIEVGTLNVNYGNIGKNYTTVSHNYAYIDENWMGAVVTYNEVQGTINLNAGTVYGNDGTITWNEIGTVNFNRGLIKKNDTGATINTNWLTVENNFGTIETNDNRYGGAIVTNFGTVQTNLSGAVVLNSTYSDYIYGDFIGVVTTNKGEVYNLGGTVGTNTDAGTEYFQINIVKNAAHTAVSSSGLKDAYDKLWLGHAATATITLTPAEGYEINGVTGLPNNVTAQKNSNGIWTLTVSGGAATTINIPEATVKPYTVTVNNGTGGGNYRDGDSVTITAVAPGGDMVFAGWTGADDLFFIEGSAATPTATFEMPKRDVALTAVFYNKNDLNGDGSVTIADVTFLLDELSGSSVHDATFDLNGDGNITISDVTYLLDYLSESGQS